MRNGQFQPKVVKLQSLHGREMLHNDEIIFLRSFQILYIFVLLAEKINTFVIYSTRCSQNTLHFERLDYNSLKKHYENIQVNDCQHGAFHMITQLRHIRMNTKNTSRFYNL